MKGLLTLFVAAFVTSFSAPALADNTHLGVDHRDIIHLRLTFGTTVCGESGLLQGPLKLVRPRGMLDDNEYFVPSGKELVITDITYSLKPAFDSNSATWVADQIAFPYLYTANDQGQLTGIVLELPGIEPPPDRNSFVTGAVTYTAGVRLAPDKAICGRVENRSPSGSSNGAISNLEVLGYLIDKSI